MRERPFKLTSPRKLKVVENDVEAAGRDLLRYRRLYPLRQNAGRFKTADNRWITIGEPGIPDYVIPRFFVEFKKPGGQLSQVQRDKIYQLETFWDLETAVVESVEDLLRWLGRHPKL